MIYTVVLLYPDYLTNDFGADICVESVEAPRAEIAVRTAQQKCCHDFAPDIDPEDLRMILVMEGDVKVVGDATGIYGPRKAQP